MRPHSFLSKTQDNQILVNNQERSRLCNAGTTKSQSRSQGYFGESYMHRSVLKSPPLPSQAYRGVAMDGVHTKDGSLRSIRDLVSQLWFDDWDEVTSGAIGLCDLTVPSNPHAVVNRERVGSTPSAIEGLERMLRSGVVNAAFHACEALSQLAFRNSRNGARIMSCANPNMMRSLDNLLTLNDPALDGDSLSELKTAVLRVLNNCAWNSRQICVHITEDASIVAHVEEILMAAKHTFEGRDAVLAMLDAGIGLLNHLSSHTHGRDALLKRNTAQLVLLPIVLEAEARTSAPEMYLCAVAGAVEVMIKLLWDTGTADPPFVPHRAVLQTIVWTLVCSLDGVTWAGITWSSLGRVQALSQLSAAGAVRATLVELSLVETLSRLLHQWTQEQGMLVLEHALLTLLNLMALGEARWRMYRAGVHGALRTLIADPDEISATARERVVLCVWLLYEWQVGKLETLDRRTAELVRALEDSERARLGLEMECARLRADWEGALEALEDGQNALVVSCEALASELHGTRQALRTVQARREMESAAAMSFVAQAGEAARTGSALAQEVQRHGSSPLPADQQEQLLRSVQALQEEMGRLALACQVEAKRNGDHKLNAMKVFDMLPDRFASTGLSLCEMEGLGITMGPALASSSDQDPATSHGPGVSVCAGHRELASLAYFHTKSCENTAGSASFGGDAKVSFPGDKYIIGESNDQRNSVFDSLHDIKIQRDAERIALQLPVTAIETYRVESILDDGGRLQLGLPLKANNSCETMSSGQTSEFSPDCPIPNTCVAVAEVMLEQPLLRPGSTDSTLLDTGKAAEILSSSDEVSAKESRLVGVQPCRAEDTLAGSGTQASPGSVLVMMENDYNSSDSCYCPSRQRAGCRIQMLQ